MLFQELKNVPTLIATREEEEHYRRLALYLLKGELLTISMVFILIQ